MNKEARLYIKYIKIHFLSGLEYKGWWLMVIQGFTVVAADILPVLLAFDRFGSIGIWTVERIILIYSLATTSFNLAESFCRGFDYFPWQMLRSGNFDRLLLRPKSLFTQVSGSFFHIHRLGRAAVGMGIIIWALGRNGVAMTPHNLSILVLALAGGVLTYTGVFVMSSGIAFFTIRALDWIYILTNASYQVTRIPLDHMPRILKTAFTFFMPMLVVSYYPAAAICGWGGNTWAGWLALPAGCVFLGFSLIIWRVGVRHYKSTGS